MNPYVFQENRQDQELLRLRLIEEALDPATIAHLQWTNVGAGWHCLELGAGAGSIARWLGSAVGDRGKVVAVDLETSHLQHLSGQPYRIVKGAFLEVSIDGEFDLAHCRYVLIHNRESQGMLEKLSALLRPGGLLLVEEPDFTSAMLLNKGGDRSQQRVNNAICRMFEQLELDPGYGLTLPQKVAALGLQVLRVDARLHLNCGGDAVARMMGASTQALRDKYLATREADPADIEGYIANANNARFRAVYYSTVSVLAAKRGAPSEAVVS
jgi:predicted O-methyltransferase YrrM